MSGPLKRHVVQRARSLIADEQHWCRGSLAQDAKGDVISSTSAGAVKRCGLGALIAAAYELTHHFDVPHELGYMALRPLYWLLLRLPRVSSVPLAFLDTLA
jgi:hypothetical protein